MTREPGDDVAGWFSAGGTSSSPRCAAAEPDAPMWAMGRRPARSLLVRRQLHETAIHEADLRIASVSPCTSTVAVAADGIDELLDNLPSARHFAEGPSPSFDGDGETLHLHATDTPDSDGIGEWLITLQPDGYSYTHGHGKGDVAVRGPIGDLEPADVQPRRRSTKIASRSSATPRYERGSTAGSTIARASARTGLLQRP